MPRAADKEPIYIAEAEEERRAMIDEHSASRLRDIALKEVPLAWRASSSSSSRARGS